ncbi:hypothetical protein DACRYDRAFT_108165 [Dacryopinax primogenitus]|uniref:F-box domain-containing protein n=1 Tax=Dacryopinax primogenitus (strain DJM 731) TaxID=1858805 RepID=M5FV36_DACPD|nr:uncharacterized protein DACRYDRAFT_108165 [Dacryopinax primogenitus]EJU01631.1 hypothetical protein DACRYDRAFT_108165 [Dacryopinax primogenitus]
MRLPYDILALLPPLALARGDLCAWARVDAYMSRVATKLLYEQILLDASWISKVAARFPACVTRTSSGYLLLSQLTKAPLTPLLPLQTLSSHPELASHVRSFLIQLPALSGPGATFLLSLLSRTLELCTSLQTFAWECTVRCTDSVLRVLPQLRELREIQLSRPTCPLVYAPGLGRGREKGEWEYLSSWIEIGTAPPLSKLKHIYLHLPQPGTSSLWFTYLSSLSLPAPLESLYLDAPGVDAESVQGEEMERFAERQRGLRVLGLGGAGVGGRGVRGVLRECRALRGLVLRSVVEEGEEWDVLTLLEEAGPELRLAVVNEEHYTRSEGRVWQVGDPSWEELQRLKEEARWGRKDGWGGEERGSWD